MTIITLNEARKQAARRAILDALEATHWNKKAAAKLLGVSRNGLYVAMRRYGLTRRYER